VNLMMMKAILRAGRVFKITGGLILVISFITYYWVECGVVNKEAADILYWLPNMIGISLVFFGMGIREERLIKHLFYYPVSWFFGFLALLYVIDLFVDAMIDVNKVILSMILTITTCLLYYFFRKLLK